MVSTRKIIHLCRLLDRPAVLPQMRETFPFRCHQYCHHDSALPLEEYAPKSLICCCGWVVVSNPAGCWTVPSSCIKWEPLPALVVTGLGTASLALATMLVFMINICWTFLSLADALSVTVTDIGSLQSCPTAQDWKEDKERPTSCHYCQHDSVSISFKLMICLSLRNSEPLTASLCWTRCVFCLPMIEYCIISQWSRSVPSFVGGVVVSTTRFRMHFCLKNNSYCFLRLMMKHCSKVF